MGALAVAGIPPREIGFELVDAAGKEAAEAPSTDTPGIFRQLKHRELLRLGVPAAMAAEVLEIRDEAALEEMAPRLPVEAYEALFLCMAGETYE